MPFFKWSRTAANNGTADTTCPFPEGMAPSAYNDGARGQMAALANWRDDIAGAIVTTGTSSGYVVGSFSGFDSLANMSGQVIAFSPHTTNVDTVTLNVDALGAKPLRSSPGVDLVSGTLIQGTPYTAIYNNADGAFYLEGYFANPYSVPLLGGLDFWDTIAPNSRFIFPAGQAISRTVYSAAFARWGTTYGAGDGSTTFNVPDKRGRISVSLDNMGGVASGRVTTSGGGVDGATVGAVGGAQNYTIERSDLPNVAPTFSGISSPSTENNVDLGGTTTGNIAPGGSNFGFTSAPTTGNTIHVVPQGTVQSLNGGVTQTVIKAMPAAIVVPYIIRII